MKVWRQAAPNFWKLWCGRLTVAELLLNDDDKWSAWHSPKRSIGGGYMEHYNKLPGHAEILAWVLAGLAVNEETWTAWAAQGTHNDDSLGPVVDWPVEAT